jgi:hypothetical protein
MHIRPLLAAASLFVLASCSKFDKFWDNKPGGSKNENPATFQEIASIDIGEAGAAEITALDPKTNRLFVVNNGGVNKIDVINGNNPSALSVIASIDISKYNGAVNSLDVHDGMLAAGIEAGTKQDEDKIVIFNTTNYKL